MHYMPFCPPRMVEIRAKTKSLKIKKGLIMYNENLRTIPMSKHVSLKDVLSIYKTQKDATNFITNVQQPSKKIACSGMQQHAFEIFALVVNCINIKWEPCYVIIRIIEIHKTSKITMATQLKELLIQFRLYDEVVAYVNNNGDNLNTLKIALTYIVKLCVPLMIT